MEQEILKLKRELEEIKAWKRSLEMSHSIPLNIDQSFRERFIKNIGGFKDGGAGGSVNVDVYNSFNVLVPSVTGKRKIIIDGSEYNFLYQ